MESPGRGVVSLCVMAVLACRCVPASVPDGPRVVGVENGGLLFTDNPAGVSGVDAGYSLPIGNRTLWLFGDVFLLGPGPDRRYVGGLSNCALVVPAGRGASPLRRYTFLTDEKTHLARAVIPNHKGEDSKTRLWPFGGWYDPRRKRAYLYYAHIRQTGDGPFGFVVEGYGLSRADTADIQAIRFMRLRSAWWPMKNPVFGSAVVAHRRPDDPYLYVVGFEERGAKKIGKLARVHKERIEDQDSYEYFAGPPANPRWSRKLAEAADIEGLTDFPTELSVAYNAYLGGYLAVHSVGISQVIRLSLAPDPWGPYRTIAEIGAPHRAFEKAFCYAGKEHPELAEDRGRIIYITYVDSQRYWLQLLKVTLGR